jgi:hypothetical protein
MHIKIKLPWTKGMDIFYGYFGSKMAKCVKINKIFDGLRQLVQRSVPQ